MTSTPVRWGFVILLDNATRGRV